MATWTFPKFTVESGGKSSDPDVEEAMADGMLLYSYGPPPAGRWTVDPKNDWTIDQWANENGVTNTDYKEDDAEMPDEVSTYLDACKAMKLDPDEAY